MRIRPASALPVLILALASCGKAPRGGLALVDPILEALSPGAARLYGAAAGSVLVLPDQNASVDLYANLDREDPSWVLLSPLLGSEARRLLDSDPELIVAWAGPEGPGAPAPSDRLYAALFSPADAAAAAGAAIAAKAAELSAGSGQALAAAVFSGPRSDALAEAFLAAWAAAGGPGEPAVVREASGFSAEAAAGLRALDVRAAYLSSAPADLERWAADAFAEEVYLVAECPLPPSRAAGSSVDAYLAWDLRSALSSLAARVASGGAGSAPAPWSLSAPVR